MHQLTARSAGWRYGPARGVVLSLEKKQTKVEIGMGDILAAAWRSLQSTQTTVYLLVALALANLVGILVPQGAAPQAYLEKYGLLLGALVIKAGLHHVFSSTWYLLLLALLIVSAGACARRIWRLGRALAGGPSLSLLQRRLGEERSPRVTATLSGPPQMVGDELVGALRRRHYRVEATSDESGALWTVGRKYRWAGYGIVFSHLAIFAIALGALLGVWPGLALDKMIQITEGDTYTDARGDFDFSLRLNSFALEYYPDNTTVKAYKSDVSVLEGEREVKRQVVLVNYPLSYRHIRFYQSSWGIGGFSVKVTPPRGEPEVLRFPVQTAECPEHHAPLYEVPPAAAVQFTADRQTAVVAKGFTPDAEEKDGEVVGTRWAAPAHPAAQITLVTGFNRGGDHSFHDAGWLKLAKPVKVGDYQIELLTVRYYSGLNARRDFGVPLVWLGFLGLAVGLMATFYFKPHSLVAAVAPSGSGARVTMAAFEKGGAGEEKWQARTYPVIAQILEQLPPPSAGEGKGGSKGRDEDVK